MRRHYIVLEQQIHKMGGRRSSMIMSEHVAKWRVSVVYLRFLAFACACTHSVRVQKIYPIVHKELTVTTACTTLQRTSFLVAGHNL